MTISSTDRFYSHAYAPRINNSPVAKIQNGQTTIYTELYLHTADKSANIACLRSAAAYPVKISAKLLIEDKKNYLLTGLLHYLMPTYLVINRIK
ncbi:putative hydrolase (HD superfamily) [Erwinia toletana]|uniref:Hydrolase (HD superfamily) n=1 Tax=Winslowiella toletana TaxID=92490 RepID=A0ABS4PDG9_9GAMM|nr:hypothetical protein [Winslowiella toletana]MBP2170686.1 putative hydrolase (HD superfamily) [Winslowiella toletana]